MCDIELDQCEVWRETPRKARKQHRCNSCGATIVPGEKYVSHFSKLDGDTCSQAICANCDADRQAFGRAHGTFPQPSYFPELLSECIAEGDPESEKRWKPMLTALRRRRTASNASRSPKASP